MKYNLLILIIIYFTTHLHSQTFLLIKGMDICIRDAPVNGSVIMKLNEGYRCEIVKKGAEGKISGDNDLWYQISFNERLGWVFGSQTSVKSKPSQTNITFLESFKEFIYLLKSDLTKANKFVHPEYQFRNVEEGNGTYNYCNNNSSIDSLFQRANYQGFISELSNSENFPIIYGNWREMGTEKKGIYINSDNISGHCYGIQEIHLNVLKNELEYLDDDNVKSENERKQENESINKELKKYKALLDIEKRLKQEVRVVTDKSLMTFYFLQEKSKWYLVEINPFYF
ncbi:hypothetical protein [Flavivirga algicola]|uniref:SH3b domain-containing protein n=1 Tax=Flavivirga algicola TaxID=2729136 RepID=A0ABX1S1B4_9FLAO|nr:hypothetical protein [Flavivirga algicola]NMH89621.1 hypothetical protein [Flavivirga algicola]